MKKNIVIITGAPRSGTTLLSGLLTGNENCVPNIPECTVITQVIKHYHDILNYTDKERFSIYIKSKDVLNSAYKSHINSLMEIVLSNFQHEHMSHIVLKDPELCPYLDLLDDFFDVIKLVVIVRDPRNVIASMIKVGESKGEVNNDSDLDLYISDLINLIYNYYYLVHESEKFKNGDGFTLRYEDVIDDFSLIKAKLEKYVGYDLSGKAFERNAFCFDKNDPTFSINYGKDIVDTRSSFSTVLSSEHIKKIENVFSGYNERYNWW